MSTLKVPAMPALEPGVGEMMLAFSGLAARYEYVDTMLGFRTALPAAESGSQRPPKPVRPSPFVCPALVS